VEPAIEFPLIFRGYTLILPLTERASWSWPTSNTSSLSVKHNTLPGRPPAAGFRSRHFPRPFIDWRKSWAGRCSIADRRFGFRRSAKRSSLTSGQFGEKSPGYSALPKEVLPTASGLGRAVGLKARDKFLSLRHSNSRQAKCLEQKTLRSKGLLMKFLCCIAFLAVATGSPAHAQGRTELTRGR
jgi:hypothetical protein